MDLFDIEARGLNLLFEKKISQRSEPNSHS
jgi:hypothetical protein